MGCARWKRRFQEFWMGTDHKPKGRDKQLIEKQNRQEAKKDIEKDIEEFERELDEAEKAFEEFEGDK